MSIPRPGPNVFADPLSDPWHPLRRIANAILAVDRDDISEADLAYVLADLLVDEPDP